ncbi:MAG: hypothetical protein M0Z31_15750 [Clostridia bacterium]|nr:hypothetical protein [Clostridia bacterium]
MGKLRKNFFFCWNCYLEIKMEGSTTELFSIEEDGNLQACKDLTRKSVNVKLKSKLG